ncbi:C4BPA protein, partial [Crocuta crocuta]
EVCCPTPELKNGKISEQRSISADSCAFFSGEKILYTCDEKYMFEARCQADGKWYPKTPTCDDDCDFPPTVAHGYYERTQAFSVFRTEVIYKCDKGYTLVGEARLSKITCRNSHWSAPAPKCKALCQKPKIENGGVTAHKDQYVEPENVTVQCNDGYGMVGSPKLTCSKNGMWLPAVPKCKWVNQMGCEQVLVGKKLLQCLPYPEDVKMALEVYKLSVEIQHL